MDEWTSVTNIIIVIETAKNRHFAASQKHTHTRANAFFTLSWTELRCPFQSYFRMPPAPISIHLNDFLFQGEIINI